MLLLTLVWASAAQAASVVYVKDSNVWLAALDGSGQYQVTLDGSASAPYRSPSQADDGTIVAERAKELYRFKQNGQQLNPPFGTASPFGGIINPRVSPDGAKIGFSFLTVVGAFATKRVTLYSHSDRFTDPSVFGRQDSLRFSSWISNTRVLGHYGTQAIFDDVGGGDNSYTEWFYESDYGASPWVNLNDGEVAPAGDRMAVVRADYPDSAGGVIYLYDVDAIVPRGQPGATPTPVCEISGADGAAVVYHRPTWAPDGLSLVWEEPDGLHAATVPATALEPSGANCGQIGERLIVAGGASPDVGPANVAPGPREAAPEAPPAGGAASGAPAPGRPPTAAPDAPAAKPVLSGYRIVPTSFRALAAGPSVSASGRGATVSYELSAPATMTFTVQRRVAGRRSKGRCMASAARRGPRCSRYVKTRGSFKRDRPAGTDRFHFSGRIGGQRLTPGHYRLVATATDPAGNHSDAQSRGLRIVR